MKSRQQGVGSTEDLLRQIQGIDGKVLRGLRLRRLGRVTTGLSAVTALATFALEHSWSWHAAVHERIFLVPVAAFALSSAMLSQARQWLRDAREPFRYTFSIDPFEPISLPQDRRLNWARDWIRADLILMLSERIGRLSLLPQDKVTGDSPDEPASHIHISGSYGSRRKKSDRRTNESDRRTNRSHRRTNESDRRTNAAPATDEEVPETKGEETIELMPRVRVGSDVCASAVAYAVRFDVPELPDLNEDRVKYDHILERVYFNVATQIYKQIRRDIDRKIARLPTAYLRATAYFHEAQDYARSNTLDAFNDARQLYAKALDLYDWSRISLPRLQMLRRPLKLIWRRLFRIWRLLAWILAFFLPRFARRELQIARTETGYAKALLFRNILANLSGREPKRIFEARRYAREAVKRFRWIPDGVPGRKMAYFEARLIAAFAELWSGDIRAAQRQLDEARNLRPAEAEQDELFLFIAGSVEPRLQRKVRLLQRAVELRPRFEIAQFELAFNQDQLWRSGDGLDETGADLVKERYETVTTLFPANLTAWANLGYIRWLLWEPRRKDQAQVVIDAFEGGRRYKEVREESFVAELDYGLARVYAEQGDFPKAYKHYLNASRGTMAQYVPAASPDYWFDRVNIAILNRFWRFKRNVDRELARQARQSDPPLERLRKAVASFAFTDWGNACAAYYRRSGDAGYRRIACAVFREAIELNPRNLLARRSYAALQMWDKKGNPEKAKEELVTALAYEPRWLAGRLDLVKTRIALASCGKEDPKEAQTAATDLLRKLPKGLPGKPPQPWSCMRRLTFFMFFRRRRNSFLREATGPTADVLAAWVATQALVRKEEEEKEEKEEEKEEEKKIPWVARRVCRYVQAHLLPADPALLDLGDRVGGLYWTKKRRRELVRAIARTRAESDPGHNRWLRQFATAEKNAGSSAAPNLIDEPTRWLRDRLIAAIHAAGDRVGWDWIAARLAELDHWIELEDRNAQPPPLREILVTAARWPGVSYQTLKWIAAKLEAMGDPGAEDVRRRASERKDWLERLALTQRVEERLEDGKFDDPRLVDDLPPHVAELIYDEAAHQSKELLNDIRGTALPLAYLLAASAREGRAQRILYRVACAERAGDRQAVVAAQAIVHLAARRVSALGPKELSEIIRVRPWLKDLLVELLHAYDMERLIQDLNEEVRKHVKEQQSRAYRAA